MGQRHRTAGRVAVDGERQHAGLVGDDQLVGQHIASRADNIVNRQLSTDETDTAR